MTDSNFIQRAFDETKYAPSISSITTAHGGSINQAAKVTCGSENYFIKWQKSEIDIFHKEAEGLAHITNTGCIKTPRVIKSGSIEDHSFLILEYMPATPTSHSFWRSFGHAIAELHCKSAERFGYHTDNYIGSLHQSNIWNDRWVDFFIQERLEKQLMYGEKQNTVPQSLVRKVRSVYQKLEEIFPIAKPSLVHGDLWSGNFMNSANDTPVIFDPAVHYGHREAEIAFSRLFGGFDELFYHSYNEVFPLERQFEDRKDLYNLYPLLVHANLFGNNYVMQIDKILNKFI